MRGKAYDARKLALEYYKAVRKQEYPDEAENLRENMARNALVMDKLRATSSGVLVWTPAVVLIAFEIPGRLLWVELTLGYLSCLRPFIGKVPWRRVRYKRMGKERECRLDRIGRLLN